MDNYKKGEKYFRKGKHKKAFKYYLLAANEGNNAAVFDVATMYWKGWGVEKDYRKAIEYFKKLSDTGSAHATFVIGEILASIDVSEAMNIIKELWHGNIIPQEDSRINSKEMKELLGYMARHHEDLAKTFTDEQKEIFEKFHDCWDEYVSLAEAAIFEYAFRLGARLTMGVQTDEE